MFGADGEAYAASRPDYPPRIYEILRTNAAIQTRARAFEIGAGTGQATGPLLAMGCRVTAVEPDQRLAAILQRRLLQYGAALTIERQTFEEVELPPQYFDLGIAATSMHWLKADAALKKVFQLLRPGGHWAMWWTVFGDPENPDDFQRRTQVLFKKLEPGPSRDFRSGRPFALDQTSRVAELAESGFSDLDYEEIRWHPVLSATQMRRLTATFSPVARLPEAERGHFLQEISRIVDEEFKGAVRRNFITAIYTARKPAELSS